MSDDSSLSSTDEPINPKITSTVGKHIYFDEEHDDNENSTAQKIIERPISSTIRVDISDLISRCKDFIPLLADTNQNTIDKDQLNEIQDNDDELNLPDIDDNSLSEKSAKESGEASSTTDEEIIKKKRKKKKKKKKKKVKTDDQLNQDVHVNNQDLLSK